MEFRKNGVSCECSTDMRASYSFVNFFITTSFFIATYFYVVEVADSPLPCPGGLVKLFLNLGHIFAKN